MAAASDGACVSKSPLAVWPPRTDRQRASNALTAAGGGGAESGGGEGGGRWLSCKLLTIFRVAHMTAATRLLMVENSPYGTRAIAADPAITADAALMAGRRPHRHLPPPSWALFHLVLCSSCRRHCGLPRVILYPAYAVVVRRYHSASRQGFCLVG